MRSLPSTHSAIRIQVLPISLGQICSDQFDPVPLAARHEESADPPRCSRHENTHALSWASPRSPTPPQRYDRCPRRRVTSHGDAGYARTSAGSPCHGIARSHGHAVTNSATGVPNPLRTGFVRSQTNAYPLSFFPTSARAPSQSHRLAHCATRVRTMRRASCGGRRDAELAASGAASRDSSRTPDASLRLGRLRTHHRPWIARQDDGRG